MLPFDNTRQFTLDQSYGTLPQPRPPVSSRTALPEVADVTEAALLDAVSEVETEEPFPTNPEVIAAELEELYLFDRVGEDGMTVNNAVPRLAAYLEAIDQEVKPEWTNLTQLMDVETMEQLFRGVTGRYRNDQLMPLNGSPAISITSRMFTHTQRNRRRQYGPVQIAEAANSNKFDPTFRGADVHSDLRLYVAADHPILDGLAAALHADRSGVRNGPDFVNGACNPYNALLKSLDVAFNVTFYMKWQGMRCRPTELTIDFERYRNGQTAYDADTKAVHDILKDSRIVNDAIKRRGHGILYPTHSGVPQHPAYPGGHATVGGVVEAWAKYCFEIGQLSESAYNDIVVHEGYCGWGRSLLLVHYASDNRAGRLVGHKVFDLVRQADMP